MTLTKIRQRIKRTRVAKANRNVRYQVKLRGAYPNHQIRFDHPMNTAYDLHMARADSPSLVDVLFPEITS
jgi:hypothetical protein